MIGSFAAPRKAVKIYDDFTMVKNPDNGFAAAYKGR